MKCNRYEVRHFKYPKDIDIYKKLKSSCEDKIESTTTTDNSTFNEYGMSLSFKMDKNSRTPRGTLSIEIYFRSKSVTDSRENIININVDMNNIFNDSDNFIRVYNKCIELAKMQWEAYINNFVEGLF